MAVEGLKITEIIDTGKVTKNEIGISKTVHYKDLSRNNVMEIWKNFSGVSIFGDYKSDCWRIISKHKDRHKYVYFIFTDEINEILKSFILFRLNNGLDTEAETSRVVNLIHVLEDTDCFDYDKFDEFEVDAYEMFYSDTDVSETLLFMDFSGLGDFRYIKVINSLKYENKVRKIPGFTSIILFDYIISDFVTSATAEEKSFYAIVILWWELTKVIPIRPIEFFKLRTTCLSPSNSSITIERAKQRKNSKNEVKLLPHLKISKHIYVLFSEYLADNQECMTGNEFIFNADLYKKIKPRNKLVRDGFTGRHLLYVIFQNFYDDIVSKKYGFTVVEKADFIELNDKEIERIQCGDTRHIAFINMLLQGYSPYTIAQIGGHTTINQQNLYYCHLEPYISSKAYCLSRNILDGFHTVGLGYGARASIKNSMVQKEIYGDKLQTLRTIQYGYCTSENFPYECEFDECIFCPKCILNENTSKYVEMQKTKLLSELNTHVMYLQKILNFPTENKQGNVDRQTLINKINSDTEKLAMIYVREHETNIF